MSLRVAGRMRGVERTLIRRIFDSAPPGAINLGLGQPDLATPPRIALEGIRGIAAGRTGYSSTAGDPALRAAVAAAVPAFGGAYESVVITVGSQEAMYAALLTLVEPGDEVLFPNPGYPAYETMIRLVGGTPVAYPLRYANRFRIDPDDLKPLLTKRARLLILCNPSNPTGALEPAENLERLAARLASHGVAWISDEIYSGFAYDAPYVSLSEVADPATGLVVSSLSKDLAMTGWRIGWVAGPPAVTARIEAAHQYLVTCAPTVSQTAARAAFTAEGQREREEARAIFRARRTRMAEELAKIPGISFHLPDGAFYFFIDTSRYGPSLPLCTRILERRKVVTIAGIAFGSLGEGFLRISYAASEESITSGIRAIAEELAAPVQGGS